MDVHKFEGNGVGGVQIPDHPADHIHIRIKGNLERSASYYPTRTIQGNNIGGSTLGLHLDKKIILIAPTAVILAIILLLPFIAGTKSYPFAIVEGNSMYPNLQNGDFVIFQRVPEEKIANGSIIVFIQGQSGISILDSLIKPVVIHRVIGIITQYDGTVNYRTKGDNNKESDPELVKSYQVLGAPSQVIPKVGILLLFIRSPQGMVAIVGLITLTYLSNYETKSVDEEKRKKLLSALAKPTLNGELPPELFRKLELTVNYIDDLNEVDVHDEGVISLVNWINDGGLDSKWSIEKVDCPNCGSLSFRLVNDKNLEVTLCPICTDTEKLMTVKEKPNPVKEENERTEEDDEDEPTILSKLSEYIIYTHDYT